MPASTSRQVLPASSDTWICLLESAQPVMPTAMRVVEPEPLIDRPPTPMLVVLSSWVQVSPLAPPPNL